MDLNDLYGAGSDIMDAVNDAVNRNDFSGLSSSISKTVKEVSDTIQRDVREYNEKNRREDIRAPQITAPTLTEGISLQEPDTASA